jgi:hypothetical protein
MSGMDDVKRSFADWCAVAADKTAEAAKVTSRRYDKFAIGREIERRLAELGGLVCEGLRAGREDILADPRVAAIMAAVTDLERERDQKDEEIAGIRQDYAGRRQQDAAWEAGDEGGPRTDPPAAQSGDRSPEFSD